MYIHIAGGICMCIGRYVNRYVHCYRFYSILGQCSNKECPAGMKQITTGLVLMKIISAAGGDLPSTVGIFTKGLSGRKFCAIEYTILWSLLSEWERTDCFL